MVLPAFITVSVVTEWWQHTEGYDECAEPQWVCDPLHSEVTSDGSCHESATARHLSNVIALPLLSEKCEKTWSLQSGS